MTIDELIEQNEQKIKFLENIIEGNESRAKLDMLNNQYRSAFLDLLDILLYQDSLEILNYQQISLKAIKENQ